MSAFLLNFSGLTLGHIQEVLVAELGAGNMAALESIAAAWGDRDPNDPRAVYKLLTSTTFHLDGITPAELLDSLVETAKGLVLQKVMDVGPRLAAKFIPGVNLIGAIYNGVTWLLNNEARLTGLVEKLLASVPDLRAGKSDKVAEQFYGIMTGPGTALMLDLAAQQRGMGGLPKAIRNGLGYVTNQIDAALHRTIGALAKAPPLGGGVATGTYSGLLGQKYGFAYNGHNYVLYVADKGRGARAFVVDAAGGEPIPLTADKFEGTNNAPAHLTNLISKAGALEAAAKDNPKARTKLAELKAAKADVNTAEGVVVADILANACKALNAGCFAAGTKLWTADGYRDVADLQPNDLVFARDEFDPFGAIAAKVVEEKFERTGRILHLHLADGMLIRTTPEHPFFVYDKGWTQAGALEAGDRLRTDGGWVAVEECFDTGAYEKVYNLRVAGWHTYFVGEEGRGEAVWAHNAYLGKSDSDTRAAGAGYATLASGWWETLPDGSRLGATVAVTQIGSTRYVALYANVGPGDRQFTQQQIDDFLSEARAAGWVAIHTSGRIHAEMALHTQLPTARVIGISNPKGPCANECKQYFTDRNYFNIVWPGTKRASWGNV